jgi:hypothetical protein
MVKLQGHHRRENRQNGAEEDYDGPASECLHEAWLGLSHLRVPAWRFRLQARRNGEVEVKMRYSGYLMVFLMSISQTFNMLYKKGLKKIYLANFTRKNFAS